MAKKASEILSRIVGDDDDLKQQIFIERVCADIATELYEARRKSHLTQIQLAKKANTTQSAIARIEDSEYDGHSIRTIAKVAYSLGLDVSIKLSSP